MSSFDAVACVFLSLSSVLSFFAGRDVGGSKSQLEKLNAFWLRNSTKLQNGSAENERHG